MRTAWSRLSLLGSLIGALALGCGGPPVHGNIFEDVADGGEGPGVAPDVQDTPLEPSPPDPLTILAVRPDRGSYAGGMRVTVRGAGFADGAVVLFGTRMAQPAWTAVVDSHRIETVTPAGDVGPVDVAVEQGADSAVLPGGFTYDPLSVTPESGAIAGGTYVTITGSGTTFSTVTSVTFDRAACSAVVVESDTVLHCYTPAGSVGPADVSVAGSTIWDAPGAFSYFNAADPVNGGLGGGTIDGSINVTVIDAGSFLPLAGAFIIVGNDPATPHQGLSNDMGQITFSAPGLRGPVDVTAAKDMYIPTTIAVFDARDVTIFLQQIPPPSPGPLPPGLYGAQIQGEILFRAGEFCPCPWDSIPDPILPTESKVAYVATSMANIWTPNPDPGAGAVVTEANLGLRGYTFSVFARPGAMALFAVAGLLNSATGTFRPYFLGVRRGVLAGPNERVYDQDIDMIIPLDHEITVHIADLPGGGTFGPDRWVVDSYVDLGGEGVLYRSDWTIDVVNPTDPIHFAPQPPLAFDLADARYKYLAGWWTGAPDPNRYDATTANFPYSFRVLGGVTNAAGGVTIGEFLGVPNAVDPPDGGRITNHLIRWSATGAAPSFYLVLLMTFDGTPLWWMYVNGTTTSVTIPDLPAIAGLATEPAGYLFSVIWAIHVPSLDFNTWRYSDTNLLYWDAAALDLFLAQF